MSGGAGRGEAHRPTGWLASSERGPTQGEDDLPRRRPPHPEADRAAQAVREIVIRERLEPGTDGLCGERHLDPRQVDSRLTLVRRVVTHPQEPVVPDEAGVAGIAAAR